MIKLFIVLFQNNKETNFGCVLDECWANARGREITAEGARWPSRERHGRESEAAGESARERTRQREREKRERENVRVRVTLQQCPYRGVLGGDSDTNQGFDVNANVGLRLILLRQFINCHTETVRRHGGGWGPRNNCGCGRSTRSVPRSSCFEVAHPLSDILVTCEAS